MSIVSDRAQNVLTPHAPQGASWQASMKAAVRDPAVLCELLDLDRRWIEPARRAAESFGLFVPREFIARMQPRDPLDPLLRQVLPLAAELSRHDDRYHADPVGDAQAQLAPGMLQKYTGRALLITTGTCAVHCRYCFRREYPYADAPRSPGAWQGALEQIAADDSLAEIILSGGDPLTLVDGHLAELAGQIDAISHVKRLRIHTRLPVVIPSRVNRALLDWISSLRMQTIIVIHVNHPAEIDDAVAAAITTLVDAGLIVLNQSVLLAGVNDHADPLAQLSERLIELRVVPYYLHQLDRATGAAHFEVSPARGRQLIDQLRGRLPGYAVPRYVLEEPGAASKTPLA